MANRAINMKIGEYKRYNAQPVLEAVEAYIRILEMKHAIHYSWSRNYKLKMWDCSRDLSIFDWWVDDLSISRLKEMRTFLREAIKLGFTGYVCFKVGVAGCANGMWAHKLPTTDGYSPKDCDFLYRSFTPSYTYWDITYADREDGDDRLSYRLGKEFDALVTKKDLENALAELKERAQEAA